MSVELSTSPWLDVVGGFVARHRPLMVRLGNLESLFLRDQIQAVRLEKPVYVAGIARSGSTLLLEILNSIPVVTTHRYQDYPFLHVPYWWNTYLRMVPGKRSDPEERAHGDRIYITPESPEAMEEILWMSFFPHLHDDTQVQILDETTSHPGFERFYTDHLRKLLLVRGATRYASKGNYNVTRLKYLQKLFPDARFVVPIRAPRAHVASLVKQHRLFSAGERANPKALAHMQRVGHYEFGLDRRVIHVGDSKLAGRIRQAWDAGRDVEGYALLWGSVYGFLAEQLRQDQDLRECTLVLRYEDLCAEPERVLGELLRHAGLDQHTESIVQRYAGTISPPTYYEPSFTPEEEAVLDAATARVAARFGYGSETEADRPTPGDAAPPPSSGVQHTAH